MIGRWGLPRWTVCSMGFSGCKCVYVNIAGLAHLKETRLYRKRWNIFWLHQAPTPSSLLSLFHHPAASHKHTLSSSLTETCPTQQLTTTTIKHGLTLKVRIVIFIILPVRLCLHRLPIEHHSFPRLATGTSSILTSGVPQTGEVLYCKIHQVWRPLSQHLHSVALQQFCQAHRYLNTHGCAWLSGGFCYLSTEGEKISQNLCGYRVIFVYQYQAGMWLRTA